ncbi:hypothetical protein RB195_005931 [Necator americanus]
MFPQTDSFHFFSEDETRSSSQLTTSTEAVRGSVVFHDYFVLFLVGILCIFVFLVLLAICFGMKTERTKRKEKIRIMKRIAAEQNVKKRKKYKHDEKTSNSGEQRERKLVQSLSRETDGRQVLSLSHETDGRRKSKEDTRPKSSTEYAPDGSPQTTCKTTEGRGSGEPVRARSVAKTYRLEDYSESMKSFFAPYEGRAARSIARTLPIQLTASSLEKLDSEIFEKGKFTEGTKNAPQVTQKGSQGPITLKTTQDE